MSLGTALKRVERAHARASDSSEPELLLAVVPSRKFAKRAHQSTAAVPAPSRQPQPSFVRASDTFGSSAWLQRELAKQHEL